MRRPIFRLLTGPISRLPSRSVMGLGAAAFAAAAVAVVFRVSAGPEEVVLVDDLLSAHSRYELTMPLASGAQR